MLEPRIKAGLWIKMALRMADLAGRSGAVLRKGDPDAGGILVVLRGREGGESCGKCADGVGLAGRIVDDDDRMAFTDPL